MTIEAISSAQPDRIDHYTTFWSDMVVPDFKEFMQEQHDLRRAFHSALSLFHMSDWVYGAEKATSAHFSFIDKNGRPQPVRDSKQFANALADLEPDFELIRQIANSAKHLKLSHSSRHPWAPTHAANTHSGGTGFGEGGYGVDPYGGSPRVMLAGPLGADREFSSIAETVQKMWLSQAKAHGWSL